MCRGVFTQKLASEGLYAIGIDQRASLKKARSSTSNENVEFRQMTVSPENIDTLPKSDLTLLLTVIHWWHRSYGHQQAEQMFRTVCKKTDTMIFEPPNKHVNTNSVELDSMENNVEFWECYINTVLSDNVQSNI